MASVLISVALALELDLGKTLLPRDRWLPQFTFTQVSTAVALISYFSYDNRAIVLVSFVATVFSV